MVNRCGSPWEIVDVAALMLATFIGCACLAWTLTRPGVHNAAVAARNLEQLEDLLGCFRLSLAGEDLALIDRASRPGIIYPHWHQADMAGERLSPADEDIIGTIRDQVAERFGARS